jgi:hypothetical protein
MAKVESNHLVEYIDKNNKSIWKESTAGFKYKMLNSELTLWGEKIKLNNGTFDGISSNSYFSHVFVAKYVFFNINNDGKKDALVIVYSAPKEGNISSCWLVAFKNNNGTPVMVGAEETSSGSVEDISIVDDIIEIKVLTYGPDDARCCPSVRKTIKFADIDEMKNDPGIFKH